MIIVSLAKRPPHPILPPLQPDTGGLGIDGGATLNHYRRICCIQYDAHIVIPYDTIVHPDVMCIPYTLYYSMK